MDKQIHNNFIKSSNLIYASAILALLKFYFVPETLSNGKSIIFALLFSFGIGYLARIGTNWLKYFLLVITIFGLILMVSIINTIAQKPLSEIILTIINTILQSRYSINQTIIFLSRSLKLPYNGMFLQYVASSAGGGTAS